MLIIKFVMKLDKYRSIYTSSLRLWKELYTACKKDLKESDSAKWPQEAETAYIIIREGQQTRCSMISEIHKHMIIWTTARRKNNNKKIHWERKVYHKTGFSTYLPQHAQTETKETEISQGNKFSKTLQSIKMYISKHTLSTPTPQRNKKNMLMTSSPSLPQFLW